MLNETMGKAINDQINAELYSAYLYYAMSAYFEEQGLAGFGHWMRLQAIEEMIHAQKFFAYVNERGGRVVLAAIEAPPKQWDSALVAFEAVYKHEVHVSSLINKLVDLAQEEHDHATYNFLQWFVGEQVEEEASASEVVQRLKLAGQTQGGLFMLDRELGQRAITLPPQAQM
ncbi:MAG: ferritin [Deltaproteobacteria bacterium]|nr:ferritin [Deltaproteobacteria bacterium]